MKRHSSIVFILCIKLLVALAVQSASATSTLNYLSYNCKKKLKSFKVKTPSYDLFKPAEKDLHLPVIIKRKGTKDVQIELVSFKQVNIHRIYGLKFNWNNQSIIDCRGFYHSPMISLVEEYEYIDSVTTEPNNAVKISTLYFVNCGVPCHLSEVNSTVIAENNYYFPYVIDEISSPVFEYPSQWFADYLTLKELYQFMKTPDGFESFQWRGKIYNTNELRKIYEK